MKVITTSIFSFKTSISISDVSSDLLTAIYNLLFNFRDYDNWCAHLHKTEADIVLLLLLEPAGLVETM